MSKITKGKNVKIIDIKKLEEEIGASGILTDYKDHTDPAYIGPGTWNVIHRYAFKAVTPATQKSFIEFMKEVCYTFPCINCRYHCTEYLKIHPIEEYLDVMVTITDGKDKNLGVFIWTWIFHNAVNARLGKAIMNWNTVYSIYSNSEPGVCSQTCTNSAHPMEAEKISSKNDKTMIRGPISKYTSIKNFK